MPIYEYQCKDCGSQTEVMQPVGSPPPGPCESCGGELKKLLSAPAFQFKGSGWYVTDYARKKAGGDTEKSKDSPATTTDSAEKSTAKGDAKDSGKSAASSSKSET